MRYLKYGCFSISKNMIFTILMVIEVLFLFLSTNIMVASYNSRMMLKTPYDGIINHNGYYFFTEPIWNTPEEYNEFSGLFNELKSVKICTVENTEGGFVIDDEIFFKYSMPLKSGSWPLKSRDDNGNAYVVISPDLNKEVGDVIEIGRDKTAVVSGVLTDITYIPNFSVHADNVSKFYINFDYSAYLNSEGDNSAIIIAKSGFYDDAENEPVDSSCFIVYDDDISKEDIEHNEKIIEKIKSFNADEVLIPPTFNDLSAIKKTSVSYTLDVYNRMLPVILGVAAVVLIGLIGSVAINTVTQIKNYGIYFLCGSKWSDCLKISFANISIILLFSGILSALLLYLLQLFNLDYLIGQTYGWNNLFVSIGMLVGMIILSLIIPFGIIRFTSPVEVIKSEK